MNERKKVIVTGASSGIGKATAIRFAQEGWDVCLTARREDELNAVQDCLLAGHHLRCAGDYSDTETVESIREMVVKEWGVVDALINCAGIYTTADPIAAPLSEWRRPFDTMFDGAVLLTRLAVNLMNKGGRIVHITSIHGEHAEKGSSAYAIAKAALNQYCRALAVELSARNILVNAIAPGFVATAMSVQDGISSLESDWFRNNYVEGHHLPLQRAGRPEEIAGVAYFLAGPDATYITGQIITVDGGLTITF